MACCFWWLVFGILLGWLASWLFDKFFRRDGGDLLGEKDNEIRRLSSELDSTKERINSIRSQLETSSQADQKKHLAAGFGFTPQKNGQDNLTIIEGIGPKIDQLLKASGYDTFARVSEAEVSALQKILDDAGPSYRLAKPGSWPKQAAMAARGDWEQLKSYQNNLVNGIEIDDK